MTKLGIKTLMPTTLNVFSMSFLLAPLVIPYKYTINWRQCPNFRFFFRHPFIFMVNFSNFFRKIMKTWPLKQFLHVFFTDELGILERGAHCLGPKPRTTCHLGTAHSSNFTVYKAQPSDWTLWTVTMCCPCTTGYYRITNILIFLYKQKSRCIALRMSERAHGTKGNKHMHSSAW
jgi:hypothetical protein